jgi:hypothetical protein
MAQSTQPLDCYYIARRNLHLAYTIKDCNTRAKNRCIFGGVGVLRDAHCGLCAEEAIFGV